MTKRGRIKRTPLRGVLIVLVGYWVGVIVIRIGLMCIRSRHSIRTEVDVVLLPLLSQPWRERIHFLIVDGLEVGEPLLSLGGLKVRTALGVHQEVIELVGGFGPREPIDHPPH